MVIKELVVPESVAVMTLRDAVLFPQAILPLHIFESRYRQMLQDVLGRERLFAIVREAGVTANALSSFEPPSAVGCLGMIRSCHTNPDGTANLVLQGVARIHLEAVQREDPYRIARVSPLRAAPVKDRAAIERQRADLQRLLRQDASLTSEVPPEFLRGLFTLEDTAVFADLVASSLCQCADTRQQVLEAASVLDRVVILRRFFTLIQERNALFRLLQGQTPDHQIDLN